MDDKKNIKKFYCRSPVLIFLYLILIAFFAFNVTCILFATGLIASDDSWEIWGKCIVFVTAPAFMYASVMAILHWAIKKVVFTENSISINKDLKVIGVVNRLQYAVEAKFSEINRLSYMESRKDSLGHEMDQVFVDMPYLVLHCDDNTKKAINLYYFSRRQRIQIIDEVIARVQKEGRELNVKSAQELIQNYKEQTKSRLQK